VPPEDGIAPGGLRSALVLIGAYDRRSGCPVLGVINEPFYRRDPETRRYRRAPGWGWAHTQRAVPAPKP
ncbi:INPP phosphatase, partial [Eubucco bourcierii]|nr:INPP phosphatase [Eubucco bourcierii]